ncbi:hypothetical protein TGAM01_v200828 [Trichoderma gamsii]|uniref:Uncharacterized protein n=1 Tax=Trichoderma gamsii TaxID=398673 RepID=A0A2P5A1G7_9HYPO|nr:hypothetical protein TGAM01_v200828 [Trichoderma gamsii]PON30388.1 hypothetical protein TGAM01_v200828 [Trichoderma gamsii]
MAGPKMTMALVSLLLSGAFAITPYSNCQSTVTAEPQQIGSTTSNAATVISTTDSLGNPTLQTSSILATTGSAVTTSGAVSASSSASGSTTGMQHVNSTATSSNDSPSGSMTAPSAPDRTSAGAAIKAISNVALGTAVMIMAYFI